MKPLVVVNVPDDYFFDYFLMAGFEVSMNGLFWVSAEAEAINLPLHNDQLVWLQDSIELGVVI